jgi:hypothetical protein
MASFLDTLNQISQGLEGWSNSPQGVQTLLDVQSGGDSRIQAQQRQAMSEQAQLEESHYLRQQREIEQDRISRARELMATMDPNDAAKLRELMALDPTAAANFLKMYEQKAPSSTIGKIQADIDAGLIDPETGAAALKKATTIAPVFDPISQQWMYAGGQGFTPPQGGGVQQPQEPQPSISGIIPAPAGLNPVQKKDWDAKQVGQLSEKTDMLRSAASKLPELVSTVNKLGGLAEKATFTKVGGAIDWLARQAGETTEGAQARTDFISTIDNQVLPLLRDTFGAAFTQKEGDTLKATLGDPDKSTLEKKAALKSFITQKVATIQSLGREVGYDTADITAALDGLDLGGNATGNTGKLRKQAADALAQGVDPAAVAAKFKQMTGEDY